MFPQWQHISAGDCLRAERQDPNSKVGGMTLDIKKKTFPKNPNPSLVLSIKGSNPILRISQDSPEFLGIEIDSWGMAHCLAHFVGFPFINFPSGWGVDQQLHQGPGGKPFHEPMGT